ncbi:MAG: hypothetical protein R3Y09_11260 [Clostridia bacterium]
MKKLFSKILAFSMVASLLSTAVFAEEMTDIEGVTLDNVSGIADYSLYIDDEGNDVPVYTCEDYAVITLDEDARWISLVYYYSYGDSANIMPLTVDENNEYLAIYDANVAFLDNDTIMSISDFYQAIIDNEITEEEFSQMYCLAGGQITVLYDGMYSFAINYSDEDGDFDYFTFEVVDTDGVDSFVTAYDDEEIAEDVETTEETTTEEVTDEVAEEVTDEVAEEIVTGTAKAATATVIVDGEEISFEAYEINGNNYFKLRDIAAVASGSEKQFEVTWDEDLNAIGLISGEVYTEVGGELATGDGVDKEYTATTSAIYKDDEEVSFTAYEINDNNYFKLRDVCQAFDIGVTWDDATQTIGIDTSISYEE